MKAVKYVGKNDEYTDPLTGSGVTWKAGETIWMPDEFWDRAKAHPDVFELDAKAEVKVEETGEVIEDVGLKKKAPGPSKRPR